jgi:hypothetical protein
LLILLFVPKGLKEGGGFDRWYWFHRTRITNSLLFQISSSKPDYEVGSSQKLNLKRPAQDTKNIWTAKATTDENDLIDEDSLLSETDRNAKPISISFSFLPFISRFLLFYFSLFVLFHRYTDFFVLC